MKTPWIIVSDGTDPRYPWGFACLRCGTKERLLAPMTLTNFLWAARKFRDKHLECLEMSHA